MQQEISEFVNLFIEKHFYFKNANFLLKQSKAAWLSWLGRLSNEREMVSSKLTIALLLAAKYQMAAKKKTAVFFEHTISCLLDRRFNQLSYAALLTFYTKFIWFK